MSTQRLLNDLGHPTEEGQDLRAKLVTIADTDPLKAAHLCEAYRVKGFTTYEISQIFASVLAEKICEDWNRRLAAESVKA